ncbi:MAG: hypothetical protein J7J22_03915 [Candidatus Verstraetearchaeota archaeon]|nr:hypothetical protein [Candidatus Verstraetearchaeota archaeon]
MSLRTREDASRELQEFRRDVTEYFDLIIRRLARLRLIEERLDVIEEYITDLRSRLRRLETTIKEYIAEQPQPKTPITLRERKIERKPITIPSIKPAIEVAAQKAEEESSRKLVQIPFTKTQKRLERKTVTERLAVTSQITDDDLVSKLNRLTITEKEIIKVLIKYPELRGGTAIARRIGKAREHTSRLLKKLADEGILIRDESVWPYKYQVPEKVKQIIMLREQLST